MEKKKSQKMSMIAQVVSFATANLLPILTGGLGPQLVDKLRAHLTKLTELAGAHFTQAGEVKINSDTRSAARQDLHARLTAIHTTARAMSLDRLWMPRNRSDRALIDAGNSFLTQAEPIRNDLIAHGLPEAFLVELRNAVRGLESAIVSHRGSKAGRRGSMVNFDATMAEALADLKRFDAVVNNRIQDDPVLKAGWQIARHVEKVPATRSAGKTDPPSPPSPPPAAPPAMAAAA